MRAFMNSEKQYFFIGKAVSYTNYGTTASTIKLDSLRPPVGSEDILRSNPAHIGRDIDTFRVCDMFAGPLEIIRLKGEQWLVPKYHELKEQFLKSRAIDRLSVVLHRDPKVTSSCPLRSLLDLFKMDVNFASFLEDLRAYLF